MANREALRALQNRLAERMRQVKTERPGVSWLAVECGGLGLLFPLAQAGEIFGLGAVLPVPHTRAWLAGVINLRGVLYAVVDFAGFLGLRRPGDAAPQDSARLVALNAGLGVNGALLVDRLEGLRHAADMQPADAPDDAGEPIDNAPRPTFAQTRWRDAAGRVWQEINLAELAGQDQFLAIAG
jgi:twitching motility protein PilI